MTRWLPALLLSACVAASAAPPPPTAPGASATAGAGTARALKPGEAEAIFAAGCFWCVESAFDEVVAERDAALADAAELVAQVEALADALEAA